MYICTYELTRTLTSPLQVQRLRQVSSAARDVEFETLFFFLFLLVDLKCLLTKPAAFALCFVFVLSLSSVQFLIVVTKNTKRIRSHRMTVRLG